MMMKKVSRKDTLLIGQMIPAHLSLFGYITGCMCGERAGLPQRTDCQTNDQLTHYYCLTAFGF